MTTTTESGARRFVLYLHESPQGHPLQYWSFDESALDGDSLIRIGRAPENDVVISHPYVSRAHAYLRYDAGAWHVTTLSQQGLMQGAGRVDRIRLSQGDEFRLGPGGPYLRFSAVTGAEESDSTYCQLPVPQLILMLDEEQLQREVGAIAEDAYFRRLQSAVKGLRRARAGEPTEEVSVREEGRRIGPTPGRPAGRGDHDAVSGA